MMGEMEGDGGDGRRWGREMREREKEREREKK